jgi:pyruvate carboxylase
VEEVQVAASVKEGKKGVEMADKDNPYHIAAPFNADLWIVYKKAGDSVQAGEKVLSLTLMKIEYGVASPVNGAVKRVLVFADYKSDKKMVPVLQGQLLIELAPPHECCPRCKAGINKEDRFCSKCGSEINR